MNKQTYINTVREHISGRKLVIYGAGRKAQGLLTFIRQNGLDADAFWVTNTGENKKTECGLPVLDIHDRPLRSEDVLILIGVRKRWESDVVKTLTQLGYENYLISPEGIEYLSEGDLDRSRHAVLQITTQIGCGINCRYCPQDLFVSRYSADRSRQMVMSIGDFKRYVDRTDSDVIIDFAGFSEPFYNRDSVEMIKYAHETGHQVELYTTLVGLTDDEFEQIKNIPFREMVLHIPDTENNSHISITEQYLNLLQTVLNTKKPDGRSFIDWASCHGTIAEAVRPSIEGKLRVITQLHNRAGNLNGEVLEKRDSMTGPIRCSNTDSEYHNHNVLLPDGTVLLCDSDWGMQHILGNLNDEFLGAIIHGKEAQRVRELRELEDGGVICRECCYAVRVENDGDDK